MADQRVNGNLVLIGTSGGTFAFGCQPSGGGFTYLLPTTIPQIGQSLVVSSVYNGNTANLQWLMPPTAVTSVSLAAPPIFTVSGSPVVTSGTLSLSLANQSAHTVFAGPTSGSAAPTFRALTTSDINTISVTSFNGRSGVVLPQTGDYSYAQISGTPQLAQSFTAPSGQFFTSYTASTGLFTAATPTGQVISVFGRTGAVSANTGDYTVGQITGAAPLASPSFSGTNTVVNEHITGTLADGTNSVGTSGQILSSTVTGIRWINAGSGSSFSALTSGTNSTASMTVNTGAAITFIGSGTINANELFGVVISSTPPTTGQVLTATAFNAANWQTPGGGGSSSFSAIQSGTNNNAIMTVGTGAAIIASGTGAITATAAPFSAITSATNTTATMTVGSGASIVPSGTGIVEATSLATTGSPVVVKNAAAPTTGQVLTATSATSANWQTPSGGSTFTSITTGTNTTATMTVGSGAHIAQSGTGTVEATQLWNVVVSSTPPSTSQVLQATSPTAASWVTVSGTGTVTNTGGPLLAHSVVIGNGGSDVYTLSTLGTAGWVLTSQGVGLDPIWQAGGGGGGGTPGGTNQQIQYNNLGSFGGASGLTWNNSTDAFAVNTAGGTAITDSGGFGVTITTEPSVSPTVLQQDSFLSSGTSYSFSYPSNVVAGNQLVVFVGLDQTATRPLTFTDNQGNSWNLQKFFIGGGDTHGFTLYTSQAKSSGTLTISMTFVTNTNVAVLFAEIQDAVGIEQVLLNSGNSTSWSSQTLYTLTNKELLLAFDVAYHPPANLTDSFTQLQSQTLPFSSNVQMDMASENAPTIGPYTSSWTQASPGPWHTIIMSYYGSGGSIVLNAAEEILAVAPVVEALAVGTTGLAFDNAVEAVGSGTTTSVTGSPSGILEWALAVTVPIGTAFDPSWNVVRSADEMLVTAKSLTTPTATTFSETITTADWATLIAFFETTPAILQTNGFRNFGNGGNPLAAFNTTTLAGSTLAVAFGGQHHAMVGIGVTDTQNNVYTQVGYTLINTTYVALFTAPNATPLISGTDTITPTSDTGANDIPFEDVTFVELSPVTAINLTSTGSILLNNTGAGGTHITDTGNGGVTTNSTGSGAVATTSLGGWTVTDNNTNTGVSITELSTTGPGMNFTSGGELGFTWSGECDFTPTSTSNGIFFFHIPNNFVVSTLPTGTFCNVEIEANGSGDSILIKNNDLTGGFGGIEIQDSSEGGVFIDVTNAGGVFIRNSGTAGGSGIGITDQTPNGISIVAGQGGQTGAFLLLESDGGGPSSGVQIKDTGGAAGIQLIANNSAPTPQANAVVISAVDPNGLWMNNVAGVSAGPFATITSIQTANGITTVLTGTSDERLKNVVAPFARGLAAVTAINPQLYTWNEAGQKITGFSATQEFAGFIAQDVQKAIPEAIGQEGDYLSLDTRPILAALVNAVKELAAENKSLKDRITDLENKS